MESAISSKTTASYGGNALISILKACAQQKDLCTGSRLHADIVKRGILLKDFFVGNTLIHMYIKCGALVKAQEVFDELPQQDVVSWNVLIAGYAHHGHCQKAFDCLELMKLEGLSPNAVTFVSVLKACSSVGDAQKGQEIHTEILKGRFLESNNLIGNALVNMYAKCGLLSKAEEIFDNLSVHNVVSWNALITAYSQNGYNEEAVNYFKRMKLQGLFPDAVTFLCILKACGSTDGLSKQGQEIHVHIAGAGFLGMHTGLGNALVDIYAKWGMLTKAQEVFDELLIQDVISWNVLIGGYSSHSHDEKAWNCFKQMTLQGHLPDTITFSSILKACGNAKAKDKGQEIHAQIVASVSVQKDTIIGNILLAMYVKCGLLGKALQVFNELSFPDVVTWNVLIGGYVQQDHGHEAIQCFEQMQQGQIFPDWITFLHVLKACIITGADQKGQEIINMLCRNQPHERDSLIDSVIVDMFAKSGALYKAQAVFDGLPSWDAVSWTTLISGYAEHAHGNEALNCFEQMKIHGLLPDAVSLACILKVFGSMNIAENGQKVHAEIVIRGFSETDDVIGNALAGMYADLRMLEDSHEMFENLQVKDTGSWNSLIAGYAEYGYYDIVVYCFRQMHLEGVLCDEETFFYLLKSCGNLGALETGQTIHAQIVKEVQWGTDIRIGAALVNMYAKCGALSKAQEAFNGLESKNIVAWNALLVAYLQLGSGYEALNCFGRIQNNNLVPDEVTFLTVLNACGSMKELEKGQEMHSEVVKYGFWEKDIAIRNALMGMYVKCGALEKAQEVFNSYCNWTVYSLNTLLAGYSQHGCAEEVLGNFATAECIDISPNIVTFVCILKACGSIRASNKGQEIHARLIKGGLLDHNDVLGSVLVDMYAKCSLFAEAQQVFHNLRCQDVISWTALIAGYTEHSLDEEASNCFSMMQHQNVLPDLVTFLCVLKACGKMQASEKGQDVHSEIVKLGWSEKNTVIGNSMVDMYASLSMLEEAKQVFDNLVVHDIVSWNVLIAGYVQENHLEEAFDCFERLLTENFSPDGATYFSLLRVCANLQTLEKGHMIHFHIARQGFSESDIGIGNAIVDMYAKCGSVTEAQNVFDMLPILTAVSYNVLIVGYAQHCYIEEAMQVFDQMQLRGCSPDEVTFVCILKACSGMIAASTGQKIHILLATTGFLARNVVVGKALISMYAKLGLLEEACKEFHDLTLKDVISCNALISGYVEQGYGREAVECFDWMQTMGISLDVVTFICTLKACAMIDDVDKGLEVHAQIMKDGVLDEDVAIGNILIDMYVKCGMLPEAQNVFEKLSFKDEISWNALISGYAQYGLGEEALGCLKCMRLEGFSPDHVTLVNMLKACGNIGATGGGQELHAEISRKGFQEADNVVGNALLDMYSNCCMVTEALKVFEGLLIQEVISWNALIIGYAQLGNDETVFSLFDKMIEQGKEPDSVTFTVLLNACSHAGMLECSQVCFGIMNTVYSISPASEHYACMIDIFGRAGQLEKAVLLVNNFPFSTNLVAWNTLLGACRKWGDVDLAKSVFKHAVQLDERNTGAYLSIWNVFAEASITNS